MHDAPPDSEPHHASHPRSEADDPSVGYWIALTRVPGIGPSRLAALLKVVGSVENAWQAPIQALREARLDRSTIEALLNARRTVDPARELERVQRAGVTVLTVEHPAYPDALRNVERAPAVLYVRGTLLPQDELAVAIVGTRHASAYGREVAHRLASELARGGVTVVSGLALGIDAVAHRAALEAGGRTLAVLGSGVDEIWPSQNRMLGEEITRAGALLSDYPLGTRPEARNFPPRNRIVSALSRAVVVVEAGSRSGALITAQFAASQGRDVYAVPGNILNAGSAGCNALIRDGAIALTGVDDLLNALHVEHVRMEQTVREEVKPTAQEAILLKAVGREPRYIDDIVRATNIPSAVVSGMLAILEMKGLVRQTAPMFYVCT